MCYIAAAIALVAAGVSAASAYQQNKSQEAIANYNADNERDIGFQNELAFRDEARRDIAAHTARLAASNVALDAGTPLLLLSESARNKEYDAINIRRNAAAKSGAYRFQASAYGAAAPLSAAAALLSGVSSAYSAGGFGDLGKIGNGTPRGPTGSFEHAYG